MNFVFGSFTLSFNETTKKKKYNDVPTWGDQTESDYKSKFNALYIRTGKISNFFVIDIDSLNIKEAQIINDMCQKTCKLIVKTKKGYHYYFIYDKDITISKEYQRFGFDIKTDRGIINCPPGYYYYMEDEVEILQVLSPAP